MAEPGATFAGYRQSMVIATLRRAQERQRKGSLGRTRRPVATSRRGELLEEAMRRLSPEEKRILDRREQGGQWTEIAEELGSSPEAIRKRLARAVDRVAHELGLDESP